MKKFVCIHGHFYQPPRENPWTGEVDAEESAKPFHDWNERINKECYEANTKAVVFGEKGESGRHINNFSKISFDIGPTLLSWLAKKDPKTYKAIVDADKESAANHNGHGNAMAQVYNHIIMPLANKRDKITQVLWGIRDFEFHYGRKPEGMWLSETAVDKQTLNILAECGIRFTVLAPHQAKRTRHIGFGSRWQYIQNEAVDPKHAYRIILDWGRQFHIFFYDAPISRAIAFQGLLNNGDQFVHRLMTAFGHREREQLVSTGTDGESFGHHHKFGEMALAYALNKIEEHHLARVTNYAEFLEKFGSFREVDIHENSSWSCAHGVERWRSDCGCRMRHEAGWNQKWRIYLREAMDTLHEIVDQVFEEEGRLLFKDPWKARNDYIDVILNPSSQVKAEFLRKQVRKRLNEEGEKKAWDLLEAERFSLLSFTSCGWFFDDIAGIESQLVMKYALRSIELVQPYYSRNIEHVFSKILEVAQSNFQEQGTGADIFERWVKKARVLSGV